MSVVDAPREPLRTVLLRPLVCTAVGLAGNVLLAGLKLLVGLAAHSASLVADAFHSISDLVGDVGVLFSLKASARPPDSSHPYGHHQFETLGALGAALLLLLTGFLLGEDAIGKIRSGGHAEPEAMALWAAVLSIVVKELMARYTALAARIHHSPAMRTNAAHHRSDALSSVAAVVGIGGAMLGLTMLDSAAALVISLLIVKMGWDLLRENAMIVLETMPDEEFVADVRRTAATVDGVRAVSRLRIRPRGSVYSVDISITVDPELTVAQGHAIADRLERALEESVRELFEVVAHVEPHRGGRDEDGALSGDDPAG